MQLIRLTEEQESRLKKITRNINILRIKKDMETLKPYEVAKKLLEEAITNEEKRQSKMDISDITI